VVHIEQKPVPTKRSLRLKILLLLVLSWASIVRVMEESGTISNLLVEENLAHQRLIINNEFHSKSVRSQMAPM
jgi:hypothetical protein